MKQLRNLVRRPPRSTWPLILPLLAYLVLAALFAVRTPLWQVPDEPAHFNYVRWLVEQRALPVLQPGDYDQTYLEQLKSARFPPEMPIDALRYESHQPPLYYLLISPVYAATRGLSLQSQVIALRLATVLLGVPLLILTFALARAVFPRDDLLAFAAPALVATVPQHLAVSAGVENDVLAEVVMTAMLVALVRLVGAPETRGAKRGKGEKAKEEGRSLFAFSPFPLFPSAALALLSGLALLTKTTVYGGVVLTLGVLGLVAWRRRRAGLAWRPIGAIALAVVVGILLVAGWWLARNALVYGLEDPTGLRRHDAVVIGQPQTGALTPSILIQLATTAFRSGWVQLGWMAVPAEDVVYGGLAVVCLLAALGLILYLWRLRSQPDLLTAHQKGALLLLIAAAAVVVAQLGYYNLSYLQPQGRYLFPALAPLALLFALGLKELVAPRHAPAVLGLLFGALVLLDVWAVYKYLPYLAR